MTTTIAPDITPGYPSKGKKLGPAWLGIWRALENAPEGRGIDRHVLAEEFAEKHDLAPATLMALIARAAKAGLLETESGEVQTGRGKRTRTFYRIKAVDDAGA